MNDIEIMQKAIDTYGDETQSMVCMEEMAELTKELVKYWRGADNVEEIAEEIADVYITLCELQLIFGITDKTIRGYKECKLKRLRKSLDF